MITNFKIFESNNKPKLGDFVVVDIKNKEYYRPDITFFDNNIGRILRDDSRTGYYKVEFDVPFEGTTVLFFDETDIVFSSEYKKQCYLYIQSKKYNL